MSSKKYILILILFIFVPSFFLAGCKHVPGTSLISQPSTKGGYLRGDGPPEEAINVDAIADAIPKAEPQSRYGNASYSVFGKKFHVMKKAHGYKEQGLASWYGKKWHGRRTSSGEKYDMAAMTAAHRTLPLPSYARVTNLDNGKKVIVKVNDRGPFHGNRLMDLSYAAAAKLQIVGKGTGKVLVEALHPGQDTYMVKAEPTPGLAPLTTLIANATNDDKYLQFGSFSYKDNALALVREIESVTQQSPAIKSVHIGSQPYYQVKLGPIRKNTELDSLLKRIASAGLNKPLITHHA